MNPHAAEFVPNPNAAEFVPQQGGWAMPPRPQMQLRQQQSPHQHFPQQQQHGAAQPYMQQQQRMPPPMQQARPGVMMTPAPAAAPPAGAVGGRAVGHGRVNGGLRCAGGPDLVATFEELAQVVERLRREDLLCVDCEGSDLSKGSWRDGKLQEDPAVPLHGALCLLQIGTRGGEAYAIDILELGPAAFDSGLRDILQDRHITKVVHDFRQDQDALWHQFCVACEGLFDCQLCDVFCRRLQGFRTTFVQGSAKLLAAHGLELVEIPGLGAVTQEQKIQIHARFSTDRHLWERRPLPDDMIAYAKADVLPLAQLHEKQLYNLSHLLGDEQVARKLMQVGSGVYASQFKQLQVSRSRLCCNAEENARFDGHRVFNQMLATGEVDGWVMQRIWRPEDANPLAEPGPSKFYVNEHDESVPLERQPAR